MISILNSVALRSRKAEVKALRSRKVASGPLAPEGPALAIVTAMPPPPGQPGGGSRAQALPTSPFLGTCSRSPALLCSPFRDQTADMAPFAEFHVGSVLEGREEDPQSREVLTHSLWEGDGIWKLLLRGHLLAGRGKPWQWGSQFFPLLPPEAPYLWSRTSLKGSAVPTTLRMQAMAPHTASCPLHVPHLVLSSPSFKKLLSRCTASEQGHLPLPSKW